MQSKIYGVKYNAARAAPDLWPNARRLEPRALIGWRFQDAVAPQVPEKFGTHPA
jgi:hypothetical protein